MFRLFLPIYLLLVIVSFYSEDIVDTAVLAFAPHAEEIDSIDDFAGGFFMAEQLLKAAPRDTWPELLTRMSAPNIPVRVRDRADVPLSEVMQRQLDANRIVVLDAETTVLAKALPDSSLLLQFGPVRVAGELTDWSMWLSMGLVAIALALAFVWTIRLQRRFSHLNRVATAFGRGEMQSRADEHPGIAVGRLNSTFNWMAGQIQELIDSHRLLTSTVSHELRSPLARIRFDLEYCQAINISPQITELMASIGEDIDRLDILVDEMLTYAKFERANLELERTVCDVNDWLCQWRDEQKIKPGGPSLDLCVTERPVLCAMHRPSMGRALDNLFGNALRFAESSIRIQLQVAGGELQLLVDDDGPGIARSHWGSLFEPFVRSENNEGQSVSGFGLGLAIVRKIARYHGGDVTVDDSPLGGARFRLTLPIAS